MFSCFRVEVSILGVSLLRFVVLLCVLVGWW